MARFDQFGNQLPELNDVLPQNSEEAERSLLGSIGHGALSGLAYLGSGLDKPRRALTGLFSGNPRELLNLIPFSDAMQLTDPAQAFHGRQLFGGDENTPFFSGAGLGGLAFDLATDPLTYLGGLGLLGRGTTRFGEAARRVGTLPARISPAGMLSHEAEAAGRLASGVTSGPLTAEQLLQGDRSVPSRLSGFAAGSPELEATGRSLLEATDPLARLGSTSAHLMGSVTDKSLGAMQELSRLPGAIPEIAEMAATTLIRCRPNYVTVFRVFCPGAEWVDWI